MLMLLAAYQLGWYGYATLQQPVPCGTNSGSSGNCANGCVGFMDLLLPSRVDNVDACIISGWTAGNGTDAFGQKQGSGFNLPPTPVGGSTANPPAGTSTPGGKAGCVGGFLVDSNGNKQYNPITGAVLRCT